MLEYQNIDLVPGVKKKITFDIRDETSLKIDLTTGFEFKFEIFDKNDTLLISKITPVSSGVGNVVFQIDGADGLLLEKGQYTYRLIITDSSGLPVQYAKGFITCDTPLFDPLSEPGASITILPDGSLYATSTVTIIPNTWYAIATYFRFVVSGVGIIALDGRDNVGNVWGNLNVMQTVIDEETQWQPSLSGMSAFRITQVSGTNIVKYLP